MKTVDKEKMCGNCDGRIPLHAERCSYCGMEQTKNASRTPIFQNQSLEDSLASLYTPPYQGKRPQFTQVPQEEPLQQLEPMYKEVTEIPKADPLIGATQNEEEVETKSSLWPTVFLLAGANFIFVGLMQLFFSKNGVLRLEWNAHYWFLYCILGVPCLYFGYKKFKDLRG
jgi:hypothetical protein